MTDNSPERLVGKLSPAQRTLLFDRLLQRQGQPPATAAIERQPRSPHADDRSGDPFPLSFAQQRLWFYDQLMPGSSLYTMPTTLHLSGQLNVPALQHAIDDLVARHESLRTTFTALDGEPRQVVRRSGRVTLSIVDLRSRSAETRAADARRVSRDDARRPFDLARGPLLRATLVWLEDEQWILRLPMHHIVSDGWSMTILVRELTQLYEARCAQSRARLPDLPVQYADFAVWQRRRLQGRRLEQELLHWQARLAGAPTVLKLPTQGPRPSIRSSHRATRGFLVSERLTATVRSFSQRQGVTPFMTLLAGFALLLGRYAGQDDVLIATRIANRARKELENLIGFFVNTLVLRVRLSRDLTVGELLRQVRETTLDAYDHQDLPFEVLVERMRPTRDLSRQPLVQVMLQLQNLPGKRWKLPQLETTPVPSHVGNRSLFGAPPPADAEAATPFDLSLHLWDLKLELRGKVEYCPELFDDGLIARFLRHYRVLLREMTADPGLRISELQMLTRAERTHLTADVSPRPAAVPDDTSVHALLEAQSSRTPDAIAVRADDEQLTYFELNRRADLAARRFGRLGVRPGTIVAFAVPPSADLVIGVFGLLKAGGLYCPLDPMPCCVAWSRRLEGTGATMVVAPGEHGPTPGITVVHPGALCAVSNPGDGTDPRPLPRVGSEHLAYVASTAGTSGSPKRVAISHRALASIVRWCAAEYMDGVAPRDMTAVLSTYQPMSSWCVPLLCGGSVAIPPQAESRAQPGSMPQCRFVTLTPSQLVMAREDLAELKSTTVIVSGERLRSRDLVAVRSSASQPRLINEYRLAEAGVACAARVSDAAERSTIPVGEPVANMHAYVLDAELEVVPAGVVGHLYVAGESLADGYVGDPRLTGEVFVPNPFSAAPGGRMFATGDRARRRADNQIELMGRADACVTLAGNRIDLAEIESLLLSHPGVRAAAVVVTDERHASALVAYVVVDADSDRIDDRLRERVRAAVADYAVPVRIVRLEALPLDPRGRVDRRALQAQAVSIGTIEAQLRRPDSAFERRLTEIWESFLPTRAIGPRDNFFEIGGHSLLAVRVIARIARDLGVALPLSTFFESPTIERLAHTLGPQVVR